MVVAMITTEVMTLIKLLTQHDVAFRWNMSARTLERWRWEGIGPAHLKIGRCVRYRLEDIEEYEQSRLISPEHVQKLSKIAG